MTTATTDAVSAMPRLPFASATPSGWDHITIVGTGTGMRNGASGFRRYEGATLQTGATTKRPLSRPEQRSG